MFSHSQPQTHSNSAAPAASQASATSVALLRAGACLVTCFVSGLGCSAQADIPEVVMTRSDVSFDGVPRLPGVSGMTNTVSTTFDHPKGFDLPAFFNPELYALSANITGLGDMRDLSFVEGITLTLSSHAEDGPPPRVMATYERTPGGAVGRVVQLDTDGDSDVLDFWGTESAFYDVTVWGVLPEQAWAIDVNVAFTGSLSVSSSD